MDSLHGNANGVDFVGFLVIMFMCSGRNGLARLWIDQTQIDAAFRGDLRVFVSEIEVGNIPPTKATNESPDPSDTTVGFCRFDSEVSHLAEQQVVDTADFALLHQRA